MLSFLLMVQLHNAFEVHNVFAVAMDCMARVETVQAQTSHAGDGFGVQLAFEVSKRNHHGAPSKHAGCCSLCTRQKH